MSPINHDRLLIWMISMLGISCIGAGAWLIFRGFQSGELLIANGALVAIQGLIMKLTGSRPTNTTNVNAEPPSNVSVTTNAPTEPPKDASRTNTPPVA